jgi:hypothetical protein
MIKKLLFISLFSWSFHLYAQSIKTDVLVIGGGPSGMAAAIQSARSKAKTILIERDSIYLTYKKDTVHFDPDFGKPLAVATLHNSRKLSSGIWDEFREKFCDFHKTDKESVVLVDSSLRYDSWSGAEVLHKMADTTKNLTVDSRIKFNSIKKDDDFWTVSIIQNGRIKAIRARVVVDATRESLVVLSAGATFQRLDSVLNKAGSKLYRTSIAMGDGLPWERHGDITAPADNYPPFTMFCVPMKAVIAKGAENLLVTEALFTPSTELQYLPRQLSIGQGVGALAAYCAFYKTTTKNLNVRAIQGEILDYKGYLMPIADITPKDPAWRAVQQICSTGLIRGVLQLTTHDTDTSPNGEAFLFKPDAIVTTAEIQPVLQEIYTRAFLWFNREKPGEKFTIGNTLSFISDYTLTDPAILKATIQKAWKTQFKFKSDFDLNRPITRREFAVLANKYLNPFARTVDLNGRLVN